MPLLRSWVSSKALECNMITSLAAFKTDMDCVCVCVSVGGTVFVESICDSVSYGGVLYFCHQY